MPQKYNFILTYANKITLSSFLHSFSPFLPKHSNFNLPTSNSQPPNLQPSKLHPPILLPSRKSVRHPVSTSVRKIITIPSSRKIITIPSLFYPKHPLSFRLLPKGRPKVAQRSPKGHPKVDHKSSISPPKLTHRSQVTDK